MKNFLKIFAFVLLSVTFSCQKENLDQATSNPYGGNNGRLVLYFQQKDYLPATIVVENKTYANFTYYWPNGVDCDDKTAPYFILPEGYHSFNATLKNGTTVSGTLYLKKGECRTFSLDL